MLLTALALLSPAHAQDLLGHWSFEPGFETADSTGHWDDLTLFGDASVLGGALDTNGVGRTPTGWATTAGYTGPGIGSKTLVSWLTLDSTGAGAGGPLGIDRTNDDDIFDTIVYAENYGLAWQTGSNNGRRNFPGPSDTDTTNLRQVAISYDDLGNGSVDIRICMDGEEVSRQTRSPIGTWQTGQAEMMMGIRHTLRGNRGALDATIEENRLYGVALTCEQIADLRMTTCSENGDMEVCRAVGDNLAQLEARNGEGLFGVGGPARFQAPALERKIDALKTALVDGGCTVTATFDRLATGEYGPGGIDGSVGATGASLSGPLDRRARSFVLTSGEGDVYGSSFAAYRRGRFVADMNGASDKVLAGQFVRDQGLNGIWLGVEATCAVHPGEALDTWFGTDIPNW